MNKQKKSFRTNPRLLSNSLTKYSTTFKALCELLNNSIQAGASNIKINLDYGKSGSIEPFIKSICILDDGHGVPASEFDNRILEIATESKKGGEGVGRFAAFQIGQNMQIETVSYDGSITSFTKLSFEVDSSELKNQNLETISFDFEEEVLNGDQKSYYKASINNLHHSSGNEITKKQKLTDEFLPERFDESLFLNYPFLIFNQTVKFHFNDNPVDRAKFIIDQPVYLKEPYTDELGKAHDLIFSFYNVKFNPSKVRLFLCQNNGGISIPIHEYSYYSNWYTEDLGSWFIYIESELFESDLFKTLEIGEITSNSFEKLRSFIKEKVDFFFQKRNEKFDRFVKDIEADTENPFKKKKASSNTHEAVFLKAAYLIEDEYHLLKKQDKIRSVIYPLLDQAISNGNIREVFERIVKLKPENQERLSDLLEKTDIESVIHFSYQVAEKLEFLEFLNKIVYGPVSRVLKERSQLHKIIEKNLWIFGEQYGNTPFLWSDRQIGGTLDELRTQFLQYDPTKEDENLITNLSEDESGLNDITDLFFYNEKICDDGYREIMIVELKSPKCAISGKELSQIDKYAFTLEQAAALGKNKVRYKILLISSRLTSFAKSKMDSARNKFQTPFLYDKKEGKEIELYVMEWSELIETNKRMLKYLSSSLDVKDRDTQEKFDQEYPEIFNENIKSSLRKVS